MYFYTAPPDLQRTDVSAVQFDPTSVIILWTASASSGTVTGYDISGGPLTRYDLYYVANGSQSTSRSSITSTFYVLTNLQVGIQYNISIVAVATYLPSQKATISVLSQFHYYVSIEN